MKYTLSFLLVSTFTLITNIGAEEYNYNSKYSSMNLEMFRYEYMVKNSKPHVTLTNYDSVWGEDVCVSCSSFKLHDFLIPANEIEDVSSWRDEDLHYFLDKKYDSSYRGKKVKFFLIKVIEKTKDKERNDLRIIYTKEYGVIAYESFEFYEDKEISQNYFLVSELGLGAVLKQ